jgi:membrane fusion protein (multidrug efflux system)
MQRRLRYLAASGLPIAALAAVHVMIAPLPELLLGGGGGTAQAQSGARPGPQGPAIVEVAEVSIGRVARDTTAVGTLVSNRSVVVSPETGGRVVAVSFQDGGSVRAGQPLVRLDSGIQRAEVAQSRANLDAVAANARRTEELLARGFATRRSQEESRAALLQIRASMQMASARLEQTVIRAPFSGTAGFASVEIGDYVAAGQDLINIEDTDPLKLDFRVPETLLTRLSPGAEISFTTAAFPGRTFRARVAGIDPRLDEGARSVSVRALAPNSSGALRPGLFATVNLVFDEREALLVPEAAVVAEGQSHFVYRVQGTRAVRTPVRLGSREAGRVELVGSPLRLGDRVITMGHEKLRGEGGDITIRPSRVRTPAAPKREQPAAMPPAAG